jgi:HSP20 family molecular chaperone IbpA
VHAPTGPVPPSTDNANANGPVLRGTERPFGPFQRILPLPPSVRLSEGSNGVLRAQVKDGVLEVRITREPTTNGTPRRVPVS